VTPHTPGAAFEGAEWLFAIGRGAICPPSMAWSLSMAMFRRGGPEEVAFIEKAASYGARAVFFEAGRHGRASVAQAFVFDAAVHADDRAFAELHKRLWSWSGVPIVYRAGPGQIQLFRCAHAPDFVGPDDTPICRPIRTLAIGAEIAVQEVWWDAARIRNGAIWDDPDACRLMLSAQKSAHRKLVEEVRELARQMGERRLLDGGLQRRLLILSLLIAYLEERSVLLPDDFARALPGATHFSRFWAMVRR
jgi:hypothetical protein